MNYFHETRDNSERRMNPYVLFEQEEVKRIAKECGFLDKAKDTDFTTDYARNLNRNLPKFHSQRTYKSLRP